jgi:energy-coupling factor transport system permease protein
MTGARSTFHALTWLIWAIAAVVCVELAPSPVYIALILAAAVAVVQVHGSEGPYRQAFRALLILGIAFALLRVALTALTTHGVGMAWLVLPTFTLPEILGGFAVGGSIEQPVVIQAMIEGLSIVAIMGVFGAFNACASHHELLERTPRAFHELGLVLTIGLSFIPATLTAVRDVHLADRARTGEARVRRGRMVRIIVPVLATGLERALALAESMDARGYASRPAARSERMSGWFAIIGVCGLGGAVIALVGAATTAAMISAGIGLIGIGTAVVLASRATGRVRYRPRELSRADAFGILSALAAPSAIVLALILGDETLSWSVSPLLWPHVAALPVLGIVFLLAPIIPIGWRLPATARPSARVEVAR